MTDARFPAGDGLIPGPALSRYVLPVGLVCAVHAGLLAVLWWPQPAAVPAPQVMKVVMVSAASEPAAPPPEPVPTPPQSKPIPRPVLPEPAPPPVSRTVAEPVASTPPPPAAAPAPAPVAAEPVIVPPRIDASYRGNPEPVYPRMSLRLNEEGTVLLRIFVKADGTVGEVVVLESSGFSRLDQAARSTVKNWKLIPARRGDEPFATWYNLPVPFRITREK